MTTHASFFVAIAKEAGDKVATADAVAFVGAQGLLDRVEVAAAVVDGLCLGTTLTADAHVTDAAEGSVGLHTTVGIGRLAAAGTGSTRSR